MRQAAVAALLLLLSGCAGVQTIGGDDALAPTAKALGLACPDGGNATACNVGLSGPQVNEFWAAANPTDPLNAIVVGNDYGAPDRRSRAEGAAHALWGVYWVTKDGGKSWTNATVGGMLTDHASPLWGYQFVGDMVAAFAPDGTCFLGGIGYTSGTVTSRNTVFIAASKDKCATFGQPVLVDTPKTEAAFFDKPAIALDSQGRLFLVWNFRQGVPPRPDEPGQQMRFGVSEDAGRTWKVKPLSRDDNGISASIAIGPDDSVNIIWRAYNPLAMRFARSEDHGATFSKATTVYTLTESSTAIAGASYRAFILPTLVALPDGRLLAIYEHREKGKNGDIQLSTSLDSGATWTHGRLDRDAGDAAQFLPTLASGADGRVVAAWLDRREGDDAAGYRLYASTSLDGTLFEEHVVSSQASAERSDRRASFIGDYIGAAISGDRLYLAWPDLRVDGYSRLFVASLVLDDAAPGPGSP